MVRKVVIDGARRVSEGREFQSRGAATEKLFLPMEVVAEYGNRALELVDLVWIV